MASKKESCAACVFFAKARASSVCRRYPPQIAFTDSATVNRSAYPFVNEIDWCGEFKPPADAATE